MTINNNLCFSRLQKEESHSNKKLTIDPEILQKISPVGRVLILLTNKNEFQNQEFVIDWNSLKVSVC